MKFFFPRSFDTFHLNKNWNHIRTSYRMTGLWNKQTNKKDQALCVVFKSSSVCVPKKYWVNDNNCGVDLQGCCGEFLCLTPLPLPRALGLCSWFMKRSTHNHSWLQLNRVFMAQKQKGLIYTREMQESFCQSKLHEVAMCSTTVQNKSKEIKVDDSDPKYLNYPGSVKPRQQEKSDHEEWL